MTTALPRQQRAILAFLSRAAEPGLALAFDVAYAVNVSSRGIGQKLAALERRGLVRRAGQAQPALWAMTDAGWKALDPAHNYVLATNRGTTLIHLTKEAEHG
jgi:predicted ArsR family transcriptional regulator